MRVSPLVYNCGAIGGFVTEKKLARKCTVIYYDSNGRGQNGETAKGLNVVRLSQSIFTDVETFSTSGWKKNPLRAFLRMKKAIKDADFVFVVLSSNGASLLGKYLNKRCSRRGVKVFYFMVGIGPLRFEADAHKKLEERAYQNITRYFHDETLWKPSGSSFADVFRRFDHVFVECETLARACKHVYGANNISVLPNFRSDDEFVPHTAEGAGELRLVYFARITPEKGIFDLIQAANELSEEGLRFSLDVYGSLQVEETVLLNAIMTSQVRYRGVATAKQTELLAAYDATVLPTKSYEGMPGTIVESLLAGTPIIVSNFTFARDMIMDGVNGFIYPFTDRNALKETLRTMIKDPTILRKMVVSTQTSGKVYLESACVHTLLGEIEKELGE